MPNPAQDYRPSTPLMEAVLLENPQEGYRWAEDLLESGEDPNQIDRITQSYPIFIAWSESRVDLIQLLLRYGAATELLHNGHFDLSAGFESASTQASLLMLKNGLSLSLLYRENEIGEKLCDGNNLITELLRSGQQDKVNALIPFGLLGLIDAYDDLGDSPLGSVSAEGNRELAGWLLKHGADINAHSESLIGSTPLDLAVGNRRVCMVEFLVNRGANPNIPTWMWKTAADRVCEYGPMKKRARHGPDKDTDLIEIRQLVLDAARRFPPPTYPNGTTPEIWPPQQGAK